jgi:hypothetical protein
MGCKETVFANGRSVATKATDHVAVNAEEFDELFLPSWKQEATINIAYMSTLEDGTVRTCIAGSSVWHVGAYLSRSEEYPVVEVPGTVGQSTRTPYRSVATCLAGSSDVFFEGKSVVRHFDSTSQDSGNSLGVVLLRSDLARLKAALDEERRKRASGAKEAPKRKFRAAPRRGPRYDEKWLKASLNDRAKAERLERRKALIRAGKAKALEYPAGSQEHRILMDAANRLEKNNSIVQMAELSSDVYDNSGAPAGWERIESHSHISGFYAAVYRSTIDPPQTVLVFRGTEILSIRDWLQDLAQVDGEFPIQYNQAARLAREVVERYPDAVITGHSLGGGLAALASAVTKMKAITWNAAGVNERTATQNGANIKDKDVINNIEAFHLYGEILTTLQESEWVNRYYGELPDAVGKPRTIPLSGARKKAWKLELHKIGMVIDEIEAQKTMDKTTLAAWAGLDDPWEEPLPKNPQ